MGSKFLSSSTAGGLEELQSGNFSVNVASIAIQSMAPSLPIRTNPNKELISGLIQLDDCNFNPISNPLSTDLDLASYAITDVKQILLENNVTPSTPPTDMLTLYTSGDRLRYKDDTTATYQVTTSGDLVTYLSKSGGTMTGPINMGQQELTNVGAVRFKDTNVTLGASSTIGASTTNNINIGNATTLGFSAQDNVLIGLQSSVNATAAGNVVIGTLASSIAGGYSTILGQQSIARGNAVSIGKESAAGFGCVTVGYRSSSGVRVDSIILGRDNVSNADSGDILGVNRTNSITNSLLLGNGSYINIRANSTCDLGTATIPFQNLYTNGSIIGTVKTSAANDLITNVGIATLGRVATFSSNKVIQDGGTLLSDLATTTAVNLRLLKSGDTMSGALAMATNNITNVGLLSGATNSRTVDNIVSNIGVSVSGNLASLSGTSGKVIADSGVVAASVVSGPVSSVSGNIAVFSGTTGKLVSDGGSALAAYLLKSGGTMTGNIIMNGNIINVNTLTDNGATGRSWGVGSSSNGFNFNTAIGSNVNCSGNDSYGFGRDIQVTTNQSLALGLLCSNSGFNSQSIGSSVTVAGGLNHIGLGAAMTSGPGARRPRRCWST